MRVVILVVLLFGVNRMNGLDREPAGRSPRPTFFKMRTAVLPCCVALDRATDNKNSSLMSLSEETLGTELVQPHPTEPEDIRKLLSAHVFLQGLAPQHIDTLAEGATVNDRTRGDLIFKQGDAARHFYIIVWGAVSLTHAGLSSNVHIQTLSAGDVLGWSWLFPPFAWHFNAMVSEPARLIVLDGERIRDCAARDHEFGYELMVRVSQVVIRRLQFTRKKFFKLSSG